MEQGKVVEMIDLTPDALKTPDGAARVKKAMDGFADTSANVANIATALLDAKERAERDEMAELWAELAEAVKLRNAAQEAFLRAMAGRV